MRKETRSSPRRRTVPGLPLCRARNAYYSGTRSKGAQLLRNKGHRTVRHMRIISLFAVFLVAAACASGQTSAPAERPTPSAASPAHDTHDGLTISVDPYSEAARSKQKFGKADPFPVGILPVEVFMRNETEQPLRIDLSTIQLEVHPDAGRQDVDSLTVAEVATIVVHPDGSSEPHTRRFPIGIPSTGDKKVDKLVEALQPFALDADVVPPRNQIHGFLFFNVSHQMSLVSNASLYVPDVTMIPSGKALIFFEVPLVSKPKE
jgi:hypothetical protein